MKIMHYSLVCALAAAPLVADDHSQNAVTVQQEEIQQQGDSNQPKSFSDRCWKYRYQIAGGVFLLTVAAFTAYLCSGVNNLPTKSATLFGEPDSTNPELPQETLLQKSTDFAYPKGYSELSKKRVDELRSAHKIFDKICGKCKWTYSCDQAVQALEEMHRTGEDQRYLIAAIAERGIDSIVDPIERLNAKAAIEQAVATLCPVAAQLNS